MMLTKGDRVQRPNDPSTRGTVWKDQYVAANGTEWVTVEWERGPVEVCPVESVRWIFSSDVGTATV
jgi:hypothetical protein